MNCHSSAGVPVAIFLDSSLENVGMAGQLWNGQPAIIINPNVTAQYSDLVTQWWFAHECGHHALPPVMNSETAADCFGVRELRRVGLLNSPQQLSAFYYELGNLPSSPAGHLPGPLRVQNIANCAMN